MHAGLETETGRMPASSRNLLEAASAKLLELWSARGSAAPSPEGAFRAAVVDAVQSLVQEWQSEIKSLSSELCAELRWCADELEISDSPNEDEFTSLVRNLPIFDPPQWMANIKRPSLALLLGTKFAQGQLRSRLSGKIEPKLHAELETYSRFVRNWAESVLKQLKACFDSYADTLRAHAGRASAQRSETTVDEQQVFHDLQLLEANDPEGPGLRRSDAESGMARSHQAV